jgi:hypothetical protein
MNKIEQLMILSFIQSNQGLCALIAKAISLGADEDKIRNIISENAPDGGFTKTMTNNVVDFFLSEGGQRVINAINNRETFTSEQ